MDCARPCDDFGSEATRKYTAELTAIVGLPQAEWQQNKTGGKRRRLLNGEARCRNIYCGGAFVGTDAGLWSSPGGGFVDSA